MTAMTVQRILGKCLWCVHCFQCLIAVWILCCHILHNCGHLYRYWFLKSLGKRRLPAGTAIKRHEFGQGLESKVSLCCNLAWRSHSVLSTSHLLRFTMHCRPLSKSRTVIIIVLFPFHSDKNSGLGSRSKVTSPSIITAVWQKFLNLVSSIRPGKVSIDPQSPISVPWCVPKKVILFFDSWDSATSPTCWESWPPWSKQESPAVADKPARRLRKVCTVYVRAVGL